MCVFSSSSMIRRDSVQPLREKTNLQHLRQLPLENRRVGRSGTSLLCLRGEVDFLFSNLLPHFKMLFVFPPEITLTLPVKTVRQNELNALFEGKAYFVIYITIWANLEVFCGSDATLNDPFINFKFPKNH